MALSLLSSSSRVETPFIIVEIAGETFGLYTKSAREQLNNLGYSSKVASTFPNYMRSLTVDKINGTVNTYTLTMIYAIKPGDDPNLLEKVFSKISEDRTMKISYGDMSMPSYIYREEEVIITDIKSDISIDSSLITYSISCTSKSLSLAAGTYSFPRVIAKPSDIIKKILFDVKYGVQEVFYGMRDKEKVLSRGLIVSDDKQVTIEAKKNISVFDYLSYLVSCMSDKITSDSILIRTSKYSLVTYDDITNQWGGPYFKVVKASSNIQENTLDTYEINIGFPGQNMVTSFKLDDNQMWSILYNYSGQINQPKYIYKINNQGEIESEYSPTLAKSNELLKTTEADKTWWTKVTQFPISGTLVIKGLLRPAILMTYIKLNVLFYGQRHISSGYYIVTKQTDTIDFNGYKTTLKLTRIRGTSINDY